MPPRDPVSPPPPGKPVKKPAAPPLIPGGWLWLLILALVVLVLLIGDPFGASDKVAYGIFKDQIINQKNVKKVLIGANKITGEFKSLDKLPDEVRDRLKN